MTTKTNIEAVALSDEQKKQIAAIVHRDCTLIPGANFYTAAELAIQATVAQLNRALLASKPAVPVQDEIADGELIADLIEQNRTLRARLAAPASPSGEDAAEEAAAPVAESHVVFITDRTQSIDDVLPQDRRWVISKAIGLVAGYRNCKASETKEAMQEFVDYMRSALADAALPRASEQADEAVTLPYVERFRESHGEGGGVYPDDEGDFMRYSDFVELFAARAKEPK